MRVNNFLALSHPTPASSARPAGAAADPYWFLKTRDGRGEEVGRCACTNYRGALGQMCRVVTRKLWGRVGLDEPGVLSLGRDGRRRHLPPRRRGDNAGAG